MRLQLQLPDTKLMRVSSTAAWGLLAQNAVAACTIPLYLLVHLATSPTASPRPSADCLAVDIPSVTTASLSVFLGYWVPFILQAIPAPFVIDFETKQINMVLWQIFPLIVGLWQYALPFGLSFLTKPPAASSKTSSASLESLRPAYVAAYVFAAVCRITMYTLIAVNTLFPDLFAPEYRGTFSISEVMIPKSARISHRPDSIGLGNLLLLHYDEMCCAAVWVVWSVYIYLQTDAAEKSFSRWATLLGRGLGAWAIAGPIGAATVCLWGRDELVLGREDDSTKKMQ